jgi:hypothetical protein
MKWGNNAFRNETHSISWNTTSGKPRYGLWLLPNIDRGFSKNLGYFNTFDEAQKEYGKLQQGKTGTDDKAVRDDSGTITD